MKKYLNERINFIKECVIRKSNINESFFVILFSNPDIKYFSKNIFDMFLIWLSGARNGVYINPYKYAKKYQK